MKNLLILLKENRLIRLTIAGVWALIFMFIHEYGHQQSNWAWMVGFVGLGYLVIDTLIGIGFAIRNELRDWINRN